MSAAPQPSLADGGLDHEARRRAGLISLVAGTAIFATKILAYLVTGSVAIYSDALESVVNVLAAGLLVWSLALAARPADSSHPYGHGKVEFFTAGVEGSLILAAAGAIALQAVRQLVAGEAPQALEQGTVLVVASALANGLLGWFLLRTGRRTSSTALVADGKHVLTDVWTSAGVVAGLLAVHFTGWIVLDPLVALAVAVNIVREGVRLVREAARGLMDAADAATLDALAAGLEAARTPAWIDLHGLRAWRSGAELHADLHLVVPRYLDAAHLHEIHEAVEQALLVAGGSPGDVIVHFDPCRDVYCPGCVMPDCPIRRAPPDQRPVWTRSHATRRQDDAGPV